MNSVARLIMTLALMPFTLFAQMNEGDSLAALAILKTNNPNTQQSIHFHFELDSEKKRIIGFTPYPRIRFDTLSPEIGKLSALQYIKLISQNITTFPKELEKLSNLERIEINGGNLTHIPLNFTKIPNLKQLSIFNHHLENIDNLSQCKNLEQVHLSGEFGKIDKGISNLKKLTHATLMGEINTIPTTIGELPLLQELQIGLSKTALIPEELGNLQNLELLDIWYGSNLPSSIRTLTKLKKLKTYYTKFSTLPDISHLSKLEILHIEGGGTLSEFPKVSIYPNLKELQLSGHSFSKIPQDIDKNKKLTTLVVHTNNELTIPSTIGALQNLTRLSIQARNRFTPPSEIFTLANLTDLLIYAHLSTIPKEIKQLNNLLYLTISSGDTVNTPNLSIPGEIYNLTQLKHLVISNYAINNISSEIIRLKNLQRLGFVKCGLKTLPEEITSLKPLYVFVNKNRLKRRNLTTSVAQWLDLRSTQWEKFQIDENSVILTESFFNKNVNVYTKQNSLYVKTNYSNPIKLQVVNMSGKVLKTAHIPQGNMLTNLMLEHYAQGTYILKISTNNKLLSTKLFQFRK